MKEACFFCPDAEAAFIAVSKDYQRMVVVCKGCYASLRETDDWLFARSSPELRRRTQAAKSA
ncbi:MAG: hypothetical protein GEU28_05010 [Dehalococcoidia bacterium]|nr:hypothetical protein [Dehalococcoidia bacterium]